jgi:hypothetical protein
VLNAAALFDIDVCDFPDAFCFAHVCSSKSENAKTPRREEKTRSSNSVSVIGSMARMYEATPGTGFLGVFASLR